MPVEGNSSMRLILCVPIGMPGEKKVSLSGNSSAG